MSSAPPDGQVLPGRSLLVRYSNLVKLPHTVFALPFALLGVVAASWVAAVTLRLVLLIVVAFTAARWVALAFNMVVDLPFDRENPRNRHRELPRGALTVAQAWLSIGLAAMVFLLTARAINPVCARLAPVAIAWVMSYSLAKRFTSWSHLWLGLSLAIAPVGAWLAIAGRWSEPWWVLVAVTVAVTTWVAGFDIFHALPDLELDQRLGLRSAVVRLGRPGALRFAAILHAITVVALGAFGVGAGFGPLYLAGVAVAAGILVAEHRLIGPEDFSRLGTVFFTLNALMSLSVFGFALLDRVL
jgi:4-hydroxybenzoate polyprenyltransferase